ncbi:MAG: magnesium transporter [Candidatus Thorarchaeota archaeon]|nr:magnesium transporter [Candidatus Thorarchaeota archaeon]
MTTAGQKGVRAAGQFFGQSLLSLLFDIGGLVAGGLLAVFLVVFTRVPWAILVFPGILSTRGAVGGLFSGRLSTALHIGSIRPSVLHNTPEYYNLLKSVVLLTLTSAVSMSVVASIFGLFIIGTTIADAFIMITVVMTTMGISLIVISPVTIGVSVISVRKGLDPDVITYPIVSTVADILVTVCYIIILVVYSTVALSLPIMWVFDAGFLIVGATILIRDRRDGEVINTLRQFITTLIIITFIVNATGTFLDQITHVVSTRPELYMVYPALIDTVGDVGSIVGSTTTTELTMGTLSPQLSGVIKQRMTATMAWAASIVMFVGYSILASVTFGLGMTRYVGFVTLLLSANVISVWLVMLFSFTLAIVTAKKGLNPDNFVIPIESSIADTITTLSVLVVLLVFP